MAGDAAMLTPSASKRSALPHRLETERLPCLATVTPQAATTSAATVDTLNVCARSPPVPHVSKTSEYSRESLVDARAHRPREAHDFRRTLPFHRQRDQETGDLRRLGAAFHDLVHGCRRLLHGEVLTALQLLDEGGEHHSSRKLRRSFRPSPVSTDSGWNCTP